jgi:outer membrane usher protein
VPELEGVRGYLNNQEVGKTNARGDLLVPNLLPYYGNRLGVADQDIPLDRSIDATEKISAPPYRGGTMVVFPVRRTQRFAGSLLIEVSGETKIPAYGQLTVTAAGERFESPISKSGHFYLENVPAGRHRAAIEFGEKVCQFELEVPKSNESTVELRDSRCVMPESKP